MENVRLVVQKGSRYNMPMTRTYQANPRYRLQIKEDTESPIYTVGPPEITPKAVRERMDNLIEERATKGRRTVMRITPEVYVRDSAKPMRYIRLPGSHMLISAPSPGQARAALKLIQRLVESINGQWLAEG